MVSYSDDSNTSWFFCQSYGQTMFPSEGQRRMLLAMLEDAVFEYNRPRSPKEHELKYCRRRNLAYLWITNEGIEDVFSFDYVCSLFGYEPSAARKKILSGEMAVFKLAG